MLSKHVHLRTCSKPSAEMLRFTAYKEFTHVAASRGNGSTVIKFASLKLWWLGYVWVSKMVLGLGKGSWRQGGGEVMDILRRCFWTTCFCIFTMEMN